MASNTVNGMRRFAPLPVALAIVALLGTDASASLDDGTKKRISGDYKGAIAALKKVTGSKRNKARLELARVHILTGDYAAAEKLAAQVAKAAKKATKVDAQVMLAEVQRITGRYKDAAAVLEPLLKKDPDHLRTRWLLGLVYQDLGQKKKARPLWDWLINRWNARKINQNSAEEQFYAAEGFRYWGDFDGANDTYRDAVNADKKYYPANLEWGELFLSKYSAGNAEQSFDEVLKHNPHHPDALAGMATVKLTSSYDLARASKYLEKALAVNPKHVPSLLVRAGVEIDQNQWKAAKATIKQVLAINPLSFPGHSLLATIYWLRDDTKNYEATRKKVFAANPEFAEFYHIIGRSAVREHRYKAAIGLEKEAVKVDPKYYEAMQAIGTGYLRLGQEKTGIKWLAKAWKGDQYNARTLNTLELFDKVIPREYSFKKTKYFKFRYHNNEKAFLERHIEPLLNKAFEDMARRYKFTPKLPVIIELFQNPDHYSVRTVGLPNLGALGVCFGQVITAMSPTVGNLNWGMVLWHELAHVWAIQMSRSRVPRWFTEGLSEYETLVARPEWRRENDADVYRALQAGTLPSVAELNFGFMKPSMNQVIVAYYLSAVTIEYIVNRWGFDKIPQALRLFGKNKETPAVIKAITGLEVAEFDKQFRAYLLKRLRPYKGTWVIPTEGFGNVTKLEIAVAAKPKDAQMHANLSMGYYQQGNIRKAKASADAAIALDKTNKLALYLSAEIAYKMRRNADAKKHYLSLVSNGGDNADVRMRLGIVEQRLSNNQAAIKQYCAAKKLDPERSFPYMQLAGIYRRTGKPLDALRELEGYVMLEQMIYAPTRQLVNSYAKLKRWDKVRTYGQLAVYINPTNAEMFITLGKAWLPVDPNKSIFNYQSALLSRPKLRRPALAHIGMARAYWAKKDKRRARAALKKAFRTEPANAEALELKKKIR